MEERYTKKYYRIREVAERIGVPATTLRYWEKEFPEVCPRRTAHNQRYYDATNIETLEIIKYLLHTKGLRVDAAKEYLAANKKNVTKRLEVIAKLESVKAELEIMLEALSVRQQKMNLEN